MPPEVEIVVLQVDIIELVIEVMDRLHGLEAPQPDVRNVDAELGPAQAVHAQST